MLMSEVHRIDGIKFNFDRLTDDELSNIRGNLLGTHRRVTDEIALVEQEIFTRANPELPFDTGTANYERLLGAAVLAGEIDCAAAYQALEAYNGGNE